MKLQKGQSAYPVPPHSHIRFVAAANGDRERNPQAVEWNCYRISSEEMRRQKEKEDPKNPKNPTLGFPQKFCITMRTEGGDIIEFWPAPDTEDYTARIRYAPPELEI